MSVEGKEMQLMHDFKDSKIEVLKSEKNLMQYYEILCVL